MAAIDDARLSGEAGELLAALARARADELRQAVAAGAPAEQIGAVVVAPDP